MQKDQQFRRYIIQSYFDNISLYCDLDLEDSKPIFLSPFLFLGKKKKKEHQTNILVTGGARFSASDVAVTGQTSQGKVVEAVHTLVTLFTLDVLLTLALTSDGVAGQAERTHRAAAARGTTVRVVFVQVVEAVLAIVALFAWEA